MSPVKSTKYIHSKVKSKPVINKPFVPCYEPYISCTNKLYFAVEIFFYYLRSERGFEEKRYYDSVTVYTCCNSPKEAVDCAMEKWEGVVKNRPENFFLQNYDLYFARVSNVYIKLDDKCWKFNNKITFDNGANETKK